MTGEDFSRYHDLVGQKIEFAAKSKQRRAIIRDLPFRNWKTIGYEMQPWELDLHDLLIEKGYTLGLHEETRFNSIDRGLIIDFDFTTRAIPQPVLDGFFVDSPVQGLTYTTSSGLTGLTDSLGKFSYRSTDIVTFTHANFVIAENVTVPADGKVTPMDIYGLPRTSTSDARVLKMARYFLTVKTNGDDASIVLGQTPIFGLISLQTNTEYDIETAIGGPLVTPETAQSHLNASISTEFSLTGDPVPTEAPTEAP